MDKEGRCSTVDVEVRYLLELGWADALGPSRPGEHIYLRLQAWTSLEHTTKNVCNAMNAREHDERYEDADEKYSTPR